MKSKDSTKFFVEIGHIRELHIPQGTHWFDQIVFLSSFPLPNLLGEGERQRDRAKERERERERERGQSGEEEVESIHLKSFSNASNADYLAAGSGFIEQEGERERNERGNSPEGRKKGSDRDHDVCELTCRRNVSFPSPIESPLLSCPPFFLTTAPLA